jgi:hypothetical protein
MKNLLNRISWIVQKLNQLIGEQNLKDQNVPLAVQLN